MKLDSIERWVRRAGVGASLAFLTVFYAGLWRGSRQPVGRMTGKAPAFLRRSPSWYLLAGGVYFGLLCLLSQPLGPALSAKRRAVALIAGVPLFFSGLALMLWGRLTLGEMYNVSTSLGAQLYAHHRLVISGPYARVRHPVYLGAQLAALGSLLIYRTWATLFATVSFAALVLPARQEEKVLAAEFGAQWMDYCREVPAWIPRLKR